MATPLFINGKPRQKITIKVGESSCCRSCQKGRNGACNKAKGDSVEVLKALVSNGVGGRMEINHPNCHK